MRTILVIMTVGLMGGIIPHTAKAQQFVTPLSCMPIMNNAPFPIHGNLVSKRYDYKSEWGDTKVSNRVNFDINPGQEETVCHKGPYFPGGRVSFIIRGAIPLFRCQTKIDEPLTVNATPKVSGDGFDITADCK